MYIILEDNCKDRNSTKDKSTDLPSKSFSKKDREKCSTSYINKTTANSTKDR
jgi:hypothetical protein